MFTGIIEAIGTVLENQQGKLTVSRPALFEKTAIGDSICVSGVCLTVVDLQLETMSFDVVPETLQKTTIGALKQNATVNLERALAADGRFQGHVVQGHVENHGEVQDVQRHESDVRVKIRLPDQLAKFVIPKGSITIDGVSLTVADRAGDTCTVALVPHTLDQTTLGALQKGDIVNLETDILIRALDWMRHYSSPHT